MKVFDINKGISDITKLADGEEKRTERHRLDMTSMFALPHLIRPIAFIWAMAMFTYAMIYCLHSDLISGLEALGVIGGLLATIVGFYFRGRTNEKNTAKKVAATIKVEEMKIKEEIRKEKVIDRRDRRKENQLKREKRRNG